MAAQHFRSAFNGFNREDVVHYIEYLNHQHRSQVEQLNNQLQAALAKAAPAEDPALQAQLDAALARIAQLEAQLAQAPAIAEPEAVIPPAATAEAELEAYRRAERTERMARERAQQIYEQANAVLADATAKAEAASSHIGAVADQVLAQLKEYQDTISGTKDTFQEAVATLYAIRPQIEEE